MMAPRLAIIFSIFLLNFFALSNLYAQCCRSSTISEKQQRKPFPLIPKNLAEVDFANKASIGKMVDELTAAANNPYTASLALMASAELGDTHRYEKIHQKMKNLLAQLYKSPGKYPSWMRSNSFKAWMWGRILSSAEQMDDDFNIRLAERQLDPLLRKPLNKADNYAFYTWAWAYRGGSNTVEYASANEKMRKNAEQLSIIYSKSNNQADLSNALWAWVMNLQAAAANYKVYDYRDFKNSIAVTAGKINDEQPITAALTEKLQRTATSNDYPAWAMAKVRLAASLMKDKALFQQMEQSTVSAIAAAQNENATAEYVLATIDNELAMVIANRLIPKSE